MAILGCLGLSLILYIRVQYEELGRTGKEFLPCKKKHKMFTIGKQKDYDMKNQLEMHANLFTIQVPSRVLGRWGIKVIEVNNRAVLLKNGNFNQWF